jgi:hypothetical protein
MRSLYEPQARPSTIFVKKFDTRCLERSPYDVQGSAARLSQPSFDLMHSYNADTRCLREVALTPIKETACRSALRRRNHSPQSV